MRSRLFNDKNLEIALEKMFSNWWRPRAALSKYTLLISSSQNYGKSNRRPSLDEQEQGFWTAGRGR